MSKGILIALLALALFSTAGFAFTTTVFPINDTYTYQGDETNHYANDTLVYISLDLNFYLHPESSFSFAWLLMNNTSPDGIISNISLTYNGTTAGVGFVFVRFSDNLTWSQHMNFSQNPSPRQNTNEIDTQSSFSHASGNNTALFAYYGIINPNLTNAVYGNSKYTLIPYGFSTGGDQYMSSIESGFPAFVTYNMVNSITSYSTSTDLAPTFFVYIDFESGKVSTSAFLGYDVQIFLSGHSMNADVPSAIFGVDNDNLDNSANIECGAQTYFPAYQSWPNINNENNFNPAGIRETFCFNMSSEHGGKQFYGAIKFVNITNVRGGSNPDLDIYYSMYAPNYSSISTLYVGNGTAGQFVTFDWTTSKPSNSTVWWRYSTNGIYYSSYLPISSATVETNHGLALSGNQVAAGFYETYAESFQADNTRLVTPAVNFTVSAPGVNDGGLGVTNGIFIKVINEGFTPIEATVAFDSVSPAQTVRMPDNSSATGYSQVAAYYGFNNTNHTVSVYKTGYSFFQLNFTVPSQPYFVTARIIPKNTCIEIYRATTNETCGANTLLLMKQSVLNYTNWYCDFDPNACTAYDNVTGGCLKSGMWKGYGCLDNYVPACGAINATCGIGSSGGIGGAFDVIAAVFGTNTDGAKGLIAMIIIAAITIFVAFKVKDGLVTGIIGLMMVGVFGVIGWVPIWLIILLVIAVAFLIAKFVRQAMTPQ